MKMENHIMITLFGDVGMDSKAQIKWILKSVMNIWSGSDKGALMMIINVSFHNGVFNLYLFLFY